MTTPTMAPVLKLDFARRGSTGKNAWENVSSIITTIVGYEVGNIS
jgi:hypothetical protein